LKLLLNVVVYKIRKVFSMEKSNRPYQSLFWPIFLVGIGILWLLGNLNIIPAPNFAALVRLWPILLIIIGLDILFGRRSALGSAVIGTVTVGAIAAFLIAGPALGLPQPQGMTIYTLNEPVEQASSAVVNLNLAADKAQVKALTDSGDLVYAKITSKSQVNLHSIGTGSKIITLDHSSINAFLSDPSSWFEQGNWDIGLTPSIPLTVNVNAGSGSQEVDLSGIKLVELKFDGGSGSSDLTLPQTAQHYTASVDGGSGSVTVSLPCSDLEIRLDGGSGSQSVSIPSGCAVRIDVRDTGSGSISLPSGMTHVSGGGSGRSQVKGIWESTGFTSGKPFVLVTIAGAGSGSISIH
jgi:hypothetical protein